MRNRVLSRARTSCKTIKRLREKERTWGEIFRICVLHSKRRRGHESRFPSDSVLRNFSISRRRHFIILYSLCSYHYYYYYYLINFFTIFPHNKFGKLFFFKKKKKTKNVITSYTKPWRKKKKSTMISCYFKLPIRKVKCYVSFDKLCFVLLRVIFFFFTLERWGVGISIDFVGLAICHPIMSWMYVYIYIYICMIKIHFWFLEVYKRLDSLNNCKPTESNCHQQ